jgi:serine protease
MGGLYDPLIFELSMMRLHPHSINRNPRFFYLLVTLTLILFSSPNFARSDQAPILIAIVDDGLVTDSDLFKGMLWQNPDEVPNNGKDDDGNGRVDDLFGWDASDQDENIQPPSARLAEYPHGTYMAAQIAGVIRQQLGELDDYPIKLIFIKAISDTASYLNMKDGYEGLETALEYDPDVINLSWAGGKLDNAASKTLAAARARDIFIVGAVGTFPQKEAAFPASHPAVFGVAGVNTHNQLFKSNYGDEVEISALALGYPENLLGKNSPEDIDGVSNSAALVTATIALMKYTNSTATNTEIKHCLQATAKPLEKFNIDFSGLLGAGVLDTPAAIECITTGVSYPDEVIKNPKGSITFTSTKRTTEVSQQWIIAPEGMFAGISLRPYVEGKPQRSKLAVYPFDPAANDANSNEVIWAGLISELPAQIKTAAPAIKLVLNASSTEFFKFQTAFATKNIDQSTRFCEGNKTIAITDSTSPVLLSDGSGQQHYTINSDCKWTIKPQAGHDLVMEFLALDTELNVDSIYLFRGEKTAQTDLLLQLSGDKLPPKIIIEGDTALLWFVSDAQNQAKGFEVKLSLSPHSTNSDEKR